MRRTLLLTVTGLGQLDPYPTYCAPFYFLYFFFSLILNWTISSRTALETTNLSSTKFIVSSDVTESPEMRGQRAGSPAQKKQLVGDAGE